MTTTATAPLIFDRVEVSRVERQEEIGDATAFLVHVRNVGGGPKESASVRAQVSGTAIGILAGSGKSAEIWLAECVTRAANAHENDGNKIRVLKAEAPLLFDSRYICD